MVRPDRCHNHETNNRGKVAGQLIAEFMRSKHCYPGFGHGHEPEPQEVKLKVPGTETVCSGTSGTLSIVIVIGSCCVCTGVCVLLTVVVDEISWLLVL